MGSVADRGTGLPRLSTPPSTPSTAGTLSAAAAESATPASAAPSLAAVAGVAGGVLLLAAMVAAGFGARARLGRLG
jgi:hypothetical protein